LLMEEGDRKKETKTRKIKYKWVWTVEKNVNKCVNLYIWRIWSKKMQIFWEKKQWGNESIKMIRVKY
jgi:hypothetical protein